MFSESSKEILWFSGCLLLLILVGVALSGISRKQIGIFQGNNTLSAKVKEQEKIVSSLRNNLRSLTKTLDSQTHLTHSSASSLSSARTLQPTLYTLIETLADQRTSLEEEIPRLTAAFAAFRKENTAQIWRKAAGEKIDSLYLKNGTMLKGVMILQVTDAGLKIQHSKGMLIVSPKELPNSYQDRFQWGGNH